jgi:hypothetical protein
LWYTVGLEQKKLVQAPPVGEEDLGSSCHVPCHPTWLLGVEHLLQKTPAKVYELSCKRADRFLLSTGTIRMYIYFQVKLKGDQRK